ncbi:hypothetical protein [Candidatus Aquarickettsia rohweri]|uniref:Uncharacterized protein n=1 Tax=Candidatus Aquarickettsia rohweri TaxID=2602574 RepID=A0A3R9XUA4_9RICK|nr:hypothetical protein [Candidatus Aquarickettsia rohweri]RST71209.1 hypothetical protein EIC27_00995 [Candidatus Aquarickettsia rohweri]
MSTQSTILGRDNADKQAASIVDSQVLVPQSSGMGGSDASRLAFSLKLDSIEGLSKNKAKNIIKIIKKDVCLNEVIASGIIPVTQKEIEEVFIQLVRPLVISPASLAKVVVDASIMKEIKRDEVYQKILMQMIADIKKETASGDSETAEKLFVLLQGDTHSSAVKVNYFLENIPAKVLVEYFLSYEEKIHDRIIERFILYDKFTTKVSEYIKKLNVEQFIELCKKTHNKEIIKYYDGLYEGKPSIDQLVLDHSEITAKNNGDLSKVFKLTLNHLKDGSDEFNSYMVTKGIQFRNYIDGYFSNFSVNFRGDGKKDVISDLMYLLRVINGNLVDHLLYKELGGQEKNKAEVKKVNDVFEQVFDASNYDRNLKRDLEELIKELNDDLIELANNHFRVQFNSILSDHFTRKKLVGLNLLKFVIKDYVEKGNAKLLKFLFENNHNLGTDDEIGEELQKLIQKSHISSYDEALKIFSESAIVASLSANDEYKKSFERPIKVMIYNEDYATLGKILKHLKLLLSQEHINQITEATKKKETIDDYYNNQVARTDYSGAIEYQLVKEEDFECKKLEEYLTTSDNVLKQEFNDLEERNDKLNSALKECEKGLSEVRTELEVRKEIKSESATTIYVQSDDKSYVFFDPIFTIGGSVSFTLFATAALVSKHMSGVDASLQRSQGFKEVQLIVGKLYMVSFVATGVSVVAGLAKYLFFSTTNDKISKAGDIIKAGAKEEDKKSSDEATPSSPPTQLPNPEAMCEQESGDKSMCKNPGIFEGGESASPTDSGDTPAELQQGEQPHVDGEN